jgi:hypothetical protein
MRAAVRYAVPRLLAAVLLTGLGLGLAPVAGPADAAVCSSDTGVTVVVDFHQLGGGVQTVCDPDGAGKTAAALFPANGFPLEYVQHTPGFVCRVSGKPADNPCVNTPPSNAYWGLFWSNGDTGQWSYASSGAGGQKIPAGGSVAFSWQGSSSRSNPGVAPPQHDDQPSSSPSSSPTSKPTAGGGSGGGAATSPTTSAGPTDTATAGPKKSGDHSRKAVSTAKHHEKKATASPSAQGTDTAAEPSAPATAPVSEVVPPDDSGGLPGWIPLAAIAVLFLTAVGVGVVQRRRT